jgi:hypothetical protein
MSRHEACGRVISRPRGNGGSESTAEPARMHPEPGGREADKLCYVDRSY